MVGGRCCCCCCCSSSGGIVAASKQPHREREREREIWIEIACYCTRMGEMEREQGGAIGCLCCTSLECSFSSLLEMALGPIDSLKFCWNDIKC
jgi:hypothetical protein